MPQRVSIAMHEIIKQDILPFFLCTGHLPVGLAVTLLSNGKCTEDHVTYVQPYFPVKEPEKIVIGSKLAYGNISAELIIEWIEAMKYIGVDKIVTYFLRSLNTDALNVLCHYAREGVVELYFYEPANEGNYSHLLFLTMMLKPSSGTDS